MKQKRISKTLSMFMAFVMLITCLATPAMATQTAIPADAPIVDSYRSGEQEMNPDGSSLESGKEVTIMVRLAGETEFMQTGDLQVATAGYDAHMAAMAQAESRIEMTLEETIEVENRYSLLFNGFSFTGEAWMIDAINEMDGVTAFEAPVFELIEPESSEETDLTPSMSKGTSLSSASPAWDLGYTGEGMAVAILDTGIRQTHEAFSVAPQNPRVDLAYLLDVYNEYGEYLHAGTVKELNDIYYSEKLPFNWDYFDGDAVPNHTSSDHGSHVAGIAAGNNGADFKGVAPDAQIFVMQVFNSTGGASFDTLMLALEDCVYLGVDAVNMSLGVKASFTAYESTIAELENVYDALEAAGVAVCVAIGNDTHANLYNNYGIYHKNQYYWSVLNPDIGIPSAPAVFAGSFAVASVVNTIPKNKACLSAYGKEYFPQANTTAVNIGTLETGMYDIVYVGTGLPEEIEAAGDVAGKIVLIKSGGTPSLNDKCANATAAGAIGIVVFSHMSGVIFSNATSTTPFGAVSKADGEALLSNFPDGIHGKVFVSYGFNYDTVTMAKTSSWGTTADLKIKPEISAPGDKITSAIGNKNDDSYATKSGTSMATPHIAGGLLLIRQSLKERLPDKTAAEINQMALAIMMNTARQVKGAVRQQGAGLIDLESAVSTEAYLTVNGGRPKLELDDSEDGKFTFAIEVNNFGKTDKSYALSFYAMTETVSTIKNYSGTAMVDHAWVLEHGAESYLINPTPVNLAVLNGTQKNVTKQVTMTAPETVTVPAGETVSVSITLECTEELMTMFREKCPAGMYLEGFIKLKDKDGGVSLSAPYLGFVGDWDYVPMFDQGFWWQIPYGQNNMAQMFASKGTYVGYGVLGQGLGLNPYWDESGETYLADRNAISPNGDDCLDAVNYIEFSLMRNPKTFKAYVTDEEGNVLQTVVDSTYTYRKESFNGNILMPGIGLSTVQPNFTAAELKENETAYIVVEAYLDHDEYEIEDNMNGRMVFPVTKDLTAPQVRVVDDGIEIIDAQYTAYYAIYADEAKTELIYENGVFADERGVAELYKTDLDTFYVVTADYARNEGFFMVQGGLVYDLGDADMFYGGKTVVGRQYISGYNSYYTWSWMEFNTETAVNVKYQDVTVEANEDTPSSGRDYISGCIDEAGTVYVNTVSKLYTQDPETKELTYVVDFSTADGTEAYVYNLMMHPDTFECYGMIYDGSVGTGFGKVDLETGVITYLWEFTNINALDVESYKWSACFIDGDTVAVHCYTGFIAYYDMETGEPDHYLKLHNSAPKYSASDYWVNGGPGAMLYNEENNSIYLFSNMRWVGYMRLGYQGVIVVDLDTGTMTNRYIDDGSVSCHGLYFKEDAKPQDWYIVIQLIDSIGEVDPEDGETIKAAREAYDALSDEDKAKVYNYETLVQAEHRYCIVMGEKYANDAKKSAEDAQKAYEDAKKEAEDAKKAAEDAKKAYEDAVKETAENKEAAEKAQKAAEEAQKKAEEAQKKAEDAKTASEEAQKKAETAQKAAEDAAKAAEESNKKAAQEALKAAEEAAKAAEESAKAAKSASDAAASANEAAKSAQAAAEAQAKAQAAQAAAEKAQKAAEEAQKKAEEAQKKAEEAAESSAEDKEAAEKAAEAAKEAQEAAEKAKEAAEQAKDAAAASAAAAEESNKAAAESAALAAQYAQEVTEMYLEIVKMKAEMTDMLAAAQKAQEAAEAAALASAKYYALTEITALTLNVEGYTQHQMDELNAAVKAAQEAIEAATTIAEVETIVEDLKAALETIAASCPAKVFTDVAEDAWYHEAVDYVVLAGMMNGKAADVFAPNANLTRAELVTVLYRMAGSPSVEDLNNPFTDVAADTWYTDAVIWAYNAEVVKGISDTAFAPTANIAREQIATILYRYAGAEAVEEDNLKGFADAGKVNAWAVEAVNWAVSVGLINGMDDVTLAPQGNATRAQIATILMRYCEG